MGYMGIDRGDGRPEELKAAAEMILVGRPAYEGPASFVCAECDQMASMPDDIEHLPACGTGKTLAKYK